MTKSEIRTLHKKQRNSIPDGEWKAFSEAVRLSLLDTKAYKNCKRIFSYVSFQSEVDTREIIHQAFLDGKRVFIPRVKEKEMEFYEIHDMGGLILSSYGIPEPQEKEENKFASGKPDSNHCKRIDSKAQFDENLMLLPGLAFDLNGNRIGYGAGYYDRYLSAHSVTLFYKIALAFDFQVIDHIAADQYDVKADGILTPTRYINCR